MPLRPRRRWLLIALTPFALLLAYLVWVVSVPNLPAVPVRLLRDATGEWSDPEGDGVSLEGQLGQIASSSSSTSHWGQTSHKGDRFSCRSIVIYGLSDHLLMRRIGADLLEELREWPGLTRIEYYPPGETSPAGSEAPDLWFELDAEHLESSGVLGRHLEAKLLVTGGSSFNLCRSHEGAPLDPTVVDFEGSMTIKHESDTLGVGTPSSRYKLAAEELAEKIAKQLADWRDDLAEDFDPLPDLPGALYPAYQPAPDLGLEEATLVASHHGLVTSNETLWRVELEVPFAEWLTGLDERLAEEGFTRTEHDFETDVDKIAFLRVTRGPETLTAYPHEQWRGLPLEGEPRHANVHYSRRMTEDEQTAGWEPVLTDPEADQETLRLLAQRGPRGLRDRAKERLEAPSEDSTE